MRVFRVRSEEWRVWQVPRTSLVSARFVEDFPQGWLCFEETGQGQRLRLPAALAPSDWEELSDIRLRQLLILARGTKVTGVTTRTISRERRELEDAAQAKRA